MVNQAKLQNAPGYSLPTSLKVMKCGSYLQKAPLLFSWPMQELRDQSANAALPTGSPSQDTTYAVQQMIFSRKPVNRGKNEERKNAVLLKSRLRLLFIA